MSFNHGPEGEKILPGDGPVELPPLPVWPTGSPFEEDEVWSEVWRSPADYSPEDAEDIPGVASSEKTWWCRLP